MTNISQQKARNSSTCVSNSDELPDNNTDERDFESNGNEFYINNIYNFRNR